MTRQALPVKAIGINCLSLSVRPSHHPAPSRQSPFVISFQLITQNFHELSMFPLHCFHWFDYFDLWHLSFPRSSTSPITFTWSIRQNPRYNFASCSCQDVLNVTIQKSRPQKLKRAPFFMIPVCLASSRLLQMDCLSSSMGLAAELSLSSLSLQQIHTNFNQTNQVSL